MIQKNYNKELHDIYKANWNELMISLQHLRDDENIKIKPANPFLLYISNERKYQEADFRVMIVGQETNGWYEGKEATIERLQKLYDEFFHGGECWRYRGQFWNGFKRMKESIAARVPDKNVEFVWNNLVKIGKNKAKGFPPNYINSLEKQYFNVLEDEIKVLEPHMVIYLTGPYYDNIIKAKFGNLKYETCSLFTTRELAKIHFPNVNLCFRTYHPNYLFRNNIDNFFESITEHLS